MEKNEIKRDIEICRKCMFFMKKTIPSLKVGKDGIGESVTDAAASLSEYHGVKNSPMQYLKKIL